MANINNILGQYDSVKHTDGTYFDKTFAVTYSSDSSAFDLTDYSGTFVIKVKKNGNTLYSKTSDDDEITFSSNTFRITDNINLAHNGRFYFELEITHSEDADKVYIIWYGDWFNER